ncbi:AAA family ATPase [bacterium]|nr:AAA family ATPase [bacterium]
MSSNGRTAENHVLTELHVANFSLLRDLSVEFTPGLNVLTGQSGAGKTLVLDAISFALGKRPNQTIIGQYGDRCSVRAEFQFTPPIASQTGVPRKLTLMRTFSRSGRGSLTLNGKPVKVAALREIVAPLIDISSQFSQQEIFRTGFHRELLDAFGDSDFKKSVSAFRARYSELNSSRKELALCREAVRRGEDERNYLEFQVSELAEANVSAGEKEQVSTELYVQEHAEEILQRVSRASHLLFEDEDDASSAFDLIARAKDELSALVNDARLEARLEGVIQTLTSLMEGITEASQLLGEIAEIQEHSADETDKLRRRLDEIQRLEHKYRVSADELPKLLADSRAKLEALSATPEQVEALQVRVDALGEKLLHAAVGINQRRREISRKLEKAVQQYLERLGFPTAQFIVEISEPDEPELDDLREHGLGHVEFIVCLNPGQPARPLAEVASGGEAARLLLAVKAALQRQLSYTTIVFDEIEAGVGGDAAFNVASVLRDLSKEHQVIAVTHLAAVAAAGHRHLDVVKTSGTRKTSIAVNELSGASRVRAVARMLGDAEHREGRALAEEFLRRFA